MKTDRKKKTVTVVEEEQAMDTFSQSDDYSSLAEVLTRRFNLSGNSKLKTQSLKLKKEIEDTDTDAENK